MRESVKAMRKGKVEEMPAKGKVKRNKEIVESVKVAEPLVKSDQSIRTSSQAHFIESNASYL